MTLGDLVIARSPVELEMLDRSGQALHSLQNLDRDVRRQVSATEQVAASVEALAQVERSNGFVLGEIRGSLGLVSDQLYRGFSQLAYEQRLQSEALRDMLEALRNPSTVQAREFRERGLYAYRNGWFEEAAAALKAAAKHDPFDFTVHQVLGDMAMLCVGDFPAAAEEFALAARYAAPVSNVDAAFARMSEARALRCAGRFGEAKRAALEAVRLAPKLPESHYVAAQAALGDGDRATARVELLQAVARRPTLALLAVNDDLLGSPPGFVGSVLEEERARLRDKVTTGLDRLHGRFGWFQENARQLLALHRRDRAEAEEKAQPAKKRSSFWKPSRGTPQPAVRVLEPEIARLFKKHSAFMKEVRQIVARDTILDLVTALRRLAAFDAEDFAADVQHAIRWQCRAANLPDDVKALVREMERLAAASG